MKVNSFIGEGVNGAATRARALEAAGLDSIATAEVAHDPFLPLTLAAEHTERIELMTAIAVAFARTPMALATIAHDLNALSRGRFILGLGSQVKGHIERRFGMPWSAPAKRMREYVLALHAIWDSWHEGKPLDFRGEFYSHTLMTPRFTPEDVSFGRPRIGVAAVGPLMTQAAAEVADALICHRFSTERYLREVTLPAVEDALARNTRPRRDFEVVFRPFTAIVHDDAEFARARKELSWHIAFYASTPPYRGLLEMHGWGDLQTEAQASVKADRWSEIGDLIDDEVFNAFAVVGDARHVADTLAQRCEGVIDRVSVDVHDARPEDIEVLVSRLKRV